MLSNKKKELRREHLYSPLNGNFWHEVIHGTLWHMPQCLEVQHAKHVVSCSKKKSMMKSTVLVYLTSMLEISR